MEANKYSYGCLMLDFNIGWWNKLANVINVSDLSEPLPNDPHVTALYGFHSDVLPQDVAKLCPPISTFKIEMVALDAFRNPAADVLMYRLESQQLNFLHYQLKTNCAATTTHPKYIPHLTLAYLKPTKANFYIQNLKIKPQTLFPYQYRFSQVDGTETCFR